MGGRIRYPLSRIKDYNQLSIDNIHNFLIGNLFAHSKATIAIKSSAPSKQNSMLNALVAPHETSVHLWQQWSKKVNASTLATAVLVMNNGFSNEEVTLSFADVPSFNGLPTSQKYSVRCLYGHKVSSMRIVQHMLTLTLS